MKMMDHENYKLGFLYLVKPTQQIRKVRYSIFLNTKNTIVIFITRKKVT